ncbi:MAG: 2,3,4,5-tetrahydropyridine-2,6-dicarboxylate N-succinyltransferase [Coxiellaceae bacterium]|nr:2,3,4,5-tetrahydropyridine-2,6-dicarboxylate N-succinyltransferase [Coxiellaceae bacterium]
MEHLETIIESAFEQRDQLSSKATPANIDQAIQETIELLDQGKIRVAEKKGNNWVVNQWIKKAVLLMFKTQENAPLNAGFTQFFDKVPLKFSEHSHESFVEAGVRVVPPATARKGAYLAPNTVLMPSYINIGAYVDSGTLVDTWATVGSCAQIGKNVHLSGGVGIGGVLEPLQASPTIIEDDCFIGARSEIVEGVIVEKGAVISMGVYIGQSTPIYNRHTQEITFGRVPAGAVVIPGALPSEDGKYSRYCAIIMKQVDEKTRSKTSLNDLLRGDIL